VGRTEVNCSSSRVSDDSAGIVAASNDEMGRGESSRVEAHIGRSVGARRGRRIGTSGPTRRDEALGRDDNGFA